MAIPRKIHYCWFGGAEKPALVEKCIASWKRYCPDCEIIEWNESNYDVTKNAYMHQAYQAKRWGFATDYARLDIVYEHGGIYLDTDVELIRDIDDLFHANGFIGYERKSDAAQQKYLVNTGQGFGGCAKNDEIKRLLAVYDNLQFIASDGKQNLKTCPYYNTQALENAGLRCDNSLQQIGDLTVYPSEYFCPLDWKTKKCTITEKTYSIHHFDASWVTDREKRKRRWLRRMDALIHLPNRCLMGLLGQQRYQALKKKLGRY